MNILKTTKNVLAVEALRRLNPNLKITYHLGGCPQG